MEKIALVNEKDEIIGFEEKMEVHYKGLLHRAFSVILYNDQGEMLLQQRSYDKYHSPGLWTNSCCSHQLEADESILEAAKRRTIEELGVLVNDLKCVGVLQYRCDFENELIENEIDSLFIGHYNGDIPFNREEINAVKWMAKKDILAWIEKEPEVFTYWFKLLIQNKEIL